MFVNSDFSDLLRRFNQGEADMSDISQKPDIKTQKEEFEKQALVEDMSLGDAARGSLHPLVRAWPTPSAKRRCWTSSKRPAGSWGTRRPRWREKFEADPVAALHEKAHSCSTIHSSLHDSAAVICAFWRAHLELPRSNAIGDLPRLNEPKIGLTAVSPIWLLPRAGRPESSCASLATCVGATTSVIRSAGSPTTVRAVAVLQRDIGAGRLAQRQSAGGGVNMAIKKDFHAIPPKSRSRP